MAILEEVNAAQAAAAANSNRPYSGYARGDKPSPKLWANIGYMKNGRFISLPLGSGIDTMEPGEVKGQNKDWIALQTDKNELLADLQAIGAKRAPGDEWDMPQLIVRMRRVNDAVVVEPTGPQLSQEERIAYLTGATKSASVEEVAAPSKTDLQAQLEAIQRLLQAS